MILRNKVSALIFLAILCFSYSCKKDKDDILEESVAIVSEEVNQTELMGDFFTFNSSKLVNYNNNAELRNDELVLNDEDLINGIKREFQSLEDSDRTIRELTEIIGYPIWDKLIKLEFAENQEIGGEVITGQAIYIPFAKADANNILGFLPVYVSEDELAFQSLVIRPTILQLTEEALNNYVISSAGIFVQFDDLIFGNFDFLFHLLTFHSINPDEDATLREYICAWITVPVWHPGTGFQDTGTGGSQSTSVYRVHSGWIMTQQYWCWNQTTADIIGTGLDSSTIIFGEGGGGGSDDSNPYVDDYDKENAQHLHDLALQFDAHYNYLNQEFNNCETSLSTSSSLMNALLTEMMTDLAHDRWDNPSLSDAEIENALLGVLQEASFNGNATLFEYVEAAIEALAAEGLYLSFVSTINNLTDRSMQYHNIFSTFCGLSDGQQGFLAFRDDVLDEILENIDAFENLEDIEFLVNVMQTLSSEGLLPFNDTSLINQIFNDCGSPESFASCMVDISADAVNNNGAAIIIDEDNEEDITTSILPYSCESFVLIPIGNNRYEVSIDKLEANFAEFSFLTFQMRYFKYQIDIDLTITTLGEDECEVKNSLANAFNAATAGAVENMGEGRVYGTILAQEEFENFYEFHLWNQLVTIFPLESTFEIEESDGGPAIYPTISAIPGQDDCCG